MTNEIVFIITFLFLGTTILTAFKFGKHYLFILSATFTIICNSVLGIEFNAFGLTISWGVVIYSLIYLITDLLSEFFEKGSAYKATIINIAIQIFFCIYIAISMKLIPTGNIIFYEHLKGLFSTTSRFTIAGIIASIGGFADVYLYEWMKEKLHRFPLYIRNNLSTITGQAINSSVFFTIALYGVVDNLIEIIISAILIKVFISILDTPFLYLAKMIDKRK